MPKPKHTILTFKAEDSLVGALRGMRNRSEFIRSALLAALDSTCPLCSGTGILSREQKKHWDAFTVNHAMKECGTCHEYHLVCGEQTRGEARPPHRHSRRKRP